MKLCLDAGNSCLKWGVADNSGWLAQGKLAWTELANAHQTLSRWKFSHAYMASVIGAVREAALAKAIGGIPIVRFTGATEFPGIRNGYAKPETLGADRWCALIGARHVEKRPCLVVMLGTATTLDALDGDGNFPGGMILPGLAMMRDALANGTANLPMTPFAEEPVLEDINMFPTDTENAIINGCLEAQAGAIERAFRRHKGASICLVSGGAAPLLVPMLSSLPVQVVPQLVLEGVRLLAAKDNLNKYRRTVP
ncbi:MAG: type III pantothenate kinase [Betaproteobacteria bacterium]|nr:type III pantothenate kinase [Betaproteobacteria bacterium]